LILTKKFVNDHPNILIIKADKGNVIVILEKDHYISNIEIFSDTYELIDKNPIKKITNGLFENCSSGEKKIV